MESKTIVSIIIILLVLFTFIYSVYFKLGSPLKEKLTNLKCEITKDFITLESCKREDITKTQEEQKQIREANENNLLNAFVYTYETCGKNKNTPCKCTLALSMLGDTPTDKPIFFIEKADKIQISIGDNKKEANIKDLLIDDPLALNHKPLDVRKVMIYTKEITGYPRYNYALMIEYNDKTKRYGGPTIGYINDLRNSIGILNDGKGNKLIYIPENQADIELFRNSFKDTTDIPNC